MPKPTDEKTLRETIAETLEANGIKPTKKAVDDIYQLVIHSAASRQFEIIDAKVSAWALREYQAEQKR